MGTGLGFTNSGVVETSIAAGIQGTIGNVVVGSLFAGAQSLGAIEVFAFRDLLELLEQELLVPMAYINVNIHHK